MFEKIRTIIDKGRKTMTSKDLAAKKGNETVATKKDGVRRWVAPAVDIYENDEEMTVLADLPGVGRDALNLGIENGALTIEGMADTLIRNGSNVETGALGYYRRFQIPEHLDLENVAAELREGVLSMRLPKAKAARPKRIEVTVH